MAGILDTTTDKPGLETGYEAPGLLERKNDEEIKTAREKDLFNQRSGEMDTAVRRKMHTRDIKGRDSSILNTNVDVVPEVETGLPFKLDTTRPDVYLDIPKSPGSDVDAVESGVYDKDGWGMNAVDFLFGAEAAVIGIAHDADGFTWNMENLKQQWSEQPIWINALSTASLVGTMLLPASLAARAAIKTGSLATKLAKGTAKEVDEIARWTDAGWINADTELAKGVKKISKYDDFEGGQASITELRRLEIATTAAGKRAKRAAAVEAGTLTWANPAQKALHSFESRFSNTYYEAINGTPGSGQKGLREAFHGRLEKLWKREEVGEMLMSLPDASKGKAISAYLMAKLDPGVAARVASDGSARGLTKMDKLWADNYWEWEKRGQASRLESGFIDDETFKRIGEGHLAAISPGTATSPIASETHMIPIPGAKPQKAAAGLIEEEVPRTGLLGKLFGGTKTAIKAADEYEYVPVQLSAKPKLTGPTMLHRAGTHDEVYDRLMSGNMISDPSDITMHGYMTSELLHDNFKFLTELATDPNNIATAEEIAIWGGDIAKAQAAGFKKLDWAGPGAAKTLARMISKKSGNPEEALPWIRSGLFDDIFGAGGMMNQTTQATNNLMGVTTTIYKTMKTGFSIPTHLQNVSGNLAFMSQAGFNISSPRNIAMLGELTSVFAKISDVFTAAKKYNLGGKNPLDADGVLKGIKLGSVKVPIKGSKGYQTFNLTDEFLNNPAMKEILETSSFHAAESAGHLADIAATLGKDQKMTKHLVNLYAKGKKIAQGGDRAKWMDKMTQAYLAEDMVPKMGLYLHYRAQGMSMKASATLVARRLPMYNTVGSAISLGRKWAFPWATFPTEALRITKNNMMDSPIRMLPWLRAPQIMQSMASGMGLAPETRGEVEEAERQLPFWAQKGTTTLTTGKAGAGIGGATMGAMGGAFLGGISGGGAGGVMAGAAVGALSGGLLAAMTTDSDHSDQLRGALQDWLPHSTFTLSITSPDFGGDALPFKNIQGMIEQSPIEPMAILQPMISIMTGEDQFGRPVNPEVGGGLAKTIAGAIGFLSPPIIQKYGFKITTPETGLLGEPTGVTNVNKLLVDTGNAIDPMTGLPGSLNHDFLLNNFSLWKSYAASAPQQIANEAKTEKHMADVRNHISRNLAFHLENGNDTDVVNLLSRVMGTFSQQFSHDPRKATSKYGEWAERWIKAIGRHPKLRNHTEDEIRERLAQSFYAQGEARSAARNNMIRAMLDELQVRTGKKYHQEGLFTEEDRSVDRSIEDNDVDRSVTEGI